MVIHCHNPSASLVDTILSARDQAGYRVETILIDDGTDTPEGMEILRRARALVSCYVVQPNKGTAAAWNRGVRAARASYIAVLRAEDLLERHFIAECLNAMNSHPDAAFVYTDSRTAGDHARIEKLEDYNLYRLLDRNIPARTALIRKEDWEAVGGYDESLPFGYTDWDFWLRLGARGRTGYHLRKALFRSREQRPSVPSPAESRDTGLAARLRNAHPELYSWQSRAHIKACWAPAVCVIGAIPEPAQTIVDWQSVETSDPAELLRLSTAEAFLLPRSDKPNRYTLELAALAIWSGHECVRLADGSIAMSRRSLAICKDIRKLPARDGLRPCSMLDASVSRPWPGPFDILRRHLINSELLSISAWAKEPMSCATRLIPLRMKEGANRCAGRVVFDLSFYLKFQDLPLTEPSNPVSPLCYIPRAPSKRHRIALITAHLGPGGAENVLLEIAAALGRQDYEILLMATQAEDRRWQDRWQERVDHIYDLVRLVPACRVGGAACSIVTNWQTQAILIQNTPLVYNAVPDIKRQMPGTTVVDLIHSVAEKPSGADLISTTAEAGGAIDLRIAISGVIRDRLLRLGISENKILLIRNGLDLEHFSLAPVRPDLGPRHILFAARLDSNKRPLLLVDIALSLLRRRGRTDFRFLVVGDGPEEERLRRRMHLAAVDHLFVFLGQVPDLRQLLLDTDLMILLSRNEGIPMVVLEAFASGRPVVASNVGAIKEVLNDANGILIENGEGEAERFAAAIDRLLDHPELRKKMGIEGRRRVEAQYDRARFRQVYRELFRKILMPS